MAKETLRNESKGGTTNLAPRSWTASLLWAAVTIGVAILASATINPLFGRYVHWDWMAGVAPAGFGLLSLAIRRRWV